MCNFSRLAIPTDLRGLEQLRYIFNKGKDVDLATVQSAFHDFFKKHAEEIYNANPGLFNAEKKGVEVEGLGDFINFLNSNNTSVVSQQYFKFVQF